MTLQTFVLAILVLSDITMWLGIPRFPPEKRAMIRTTAIVLAVAIVVGLALRLLSRH